jgi:hypothetical protein
MLIDLTNPDEVRREAERRQRLRAEGARSFDAARGVPVPEVEEDALEKAIEHEGDKLMAALGFEIVRLSQARASKVTPGVPDRRYYRRPRIVERSDGRYITRAFACWWDAKTTTGTQRPDQKLFQEMVEAVGETYLVGTHEALIRWLTVERIAELRDGVLEPIDSRVVVTAEAV